MTTLNEWVQLAAAIGLLLQGFGLVYLFKKRQASKQAKTDYANEGTANVNAGGNVIYNNRADREELLYFAQCKDLQKTVDMLLKQQREKGKTIKKLLNRIDVLESDNGTLLKENIRLEKESRMLPLIEFKKRLPEEKEEKEKAA